MAQLQSNSRYAIVADIKKIAGVADFNALECLHGGLSSLAFVLANKMVTGQIASGGN